jgi:hypothetical protein
MAVSSLSLSLSLSLSHTSGLSLSGSLAISLSIGNSEGSGAVCIENIESEGQQVSAAIYRMDQRCRLKISKGAQLLDVGLLAA